VAAALYGAYSWYRPSTPSLVLREPLLLTEFSNTTGEAVFDGALKDALEIQLQQSPFLNVLSASQVRSTLQLMARSPNEPLTSPLARDICERLGVYAILSGSIAPLSSAYVITLEAQACRSGATLASEQTQAASKTDVLATVSAAAANIREQLGESIGSIQRFNVPAPNATTPSLEALKAYSMGLETRIKTGDVQAIPLFEHALELDPNFALAAARLGSIYMNVHELDQAQNYMRRAFARSESLSEPERLFVRANYHFIVTGRLDDVVATYRMWIAAYPTDWVPHNNLSAAYQRLNQFDLALDEAREAVRLGPASVVPYQQLARVLLPLDRLPEAAAVLGDAASRRLESSVIHALAFQLAFVDRDAGRMQQHLGAAVSRPDGYLVVAEAARAAFASGDLETGRTLYAQAVSATRQARVHDMAGSLIAEEALSDALVGDSAGALRELQQAVATSAGVETTWTASLGAAFSGAAPQAAELADAFQRAAPPAPDVVSASAPMLRAAVALASNDGRRALAILTSVTPYARAAGPLLPYLRGLAHTALQEHTRAVEQFNSVVEQRGNQPTSLLHTLGLLQLARSARAAGDMARARAAYADFARAWSGAPRHPLFEAAASEAASLPPPSASVPPTR
jgi:tetratricopeptide (TPR) repeat protein